MASVALKDSFKNLGSPRRFFFRNRKRAHKSKGPQGITIKKPVIQPISPQLDSDDDLTPIYPRKKGRFEDVGNESPVPEKCSDICSRCGRMDEYKRINLIGGGAFGAVYRAVDKKTGEIVAMKKEFGGFSEMTLREIDILQSLRGHPHIVEFRQIAEDCGGNVYVVMEYMENDLWGYIRETERPFSITEVKGLMKQLLEGVKFIHENGMMHRDLKPSNILMSKGGSLKICDFGMSRRFGGEMGSYSPKVVTVCYRAPELLLGTRNYSSAIDMWSVGCIMAELLLKEILFNGSSEIDQLYEICHILGRPYLNIPGSDEMFSVKDEEGCKSNSLREKLVGSQPGWPKLTDLGFDLLNKLLACEPEERITAADALKHGWFLED